MEMQGKASVRRKRQTFAEWLRSHPQEQRRPLSRTEWKDVLRRSPDLARAGLFDEDLAHDGFNRGSFDLRGGARRSQARPARDGLHMQRGFTNAREAEEWGEDLIQFEELADLTADTAIEVALPAHRELLRPYREWRSALHRRACAPYAIVTDAVPPWPREATLEPATLHAGSKIRQPVLVKVTQVLTRVRRVRRNVYDTKMARRTRPAPSTSAYLLVPTKDLAASVLKTYLAEEALVRPEGTAFRRLVLTLFREDPPLPEEIAQRRRRWKERHS